MFPMFPAMIKDETKDSACDESTEHDKTLEQKQRAELRERFLRLMSFLGGKQVCSFHFKKVDQYKCIWCIRLRN